MRKETRLRVKHAIFYNELCSKRLSGSRLATDCVKRRELCKETRLRVKDARFCDELCSKRLSGIRLATETLNLKAAGSTPAPGS